MCNLYSITTNQAAIIALFRVVNRYVGNLAPMPGVFPDYKAPILRNGADGRELATARWGMPSSSKALMDATKKRAERLQAKGKPVNFNELLRIEPDGGTTNIRNVKSKHWTRWLGFENRCVVPFNSAEAGRRMLREYANNVPFDARGFVEQLGGYSLDSVAMGHKLVRPHDFRLRTH
jgi:putative SOS response-associated peptidase YedK